MDNIRVGSVNVLNKLRLANNVKCDSELGQNKTHNLYSFQILIYPEHI
jgi:hypothetical protein